MIRSAQKEVLLEGQDNYDIFFLQREQMFSILCGMTITNRQKQIMEFIKSFHEKEGFPPSLREICKALGLASSGSLSKHIRALEREGVLTKIPDKKRAWKLTESSFKPSIPVVGRIAAGTPILAQENREDDLPFDPAFFGSPHVFALKVSGDSMIDAKICDGDLAIIRPQSEGQNGETLAVMVEGMEPEATLKIFRIKNDQIELHAANLSYKPVVFRGADTEKIKIVGKLVGIIRSRP